MIRDLIAGMEMDYVLFEYVDWAGLTQLANQARRVAVPGGAGAHGYRADRCRPLPQTRSCERWRMQDLYELNAKLLPLPAADEWFQTLPQHKVAVSLGTDTHDDLDSIRQMGELYAFAQRRGLAVKLLAPRCARKAGARGTAGVGGSGSVRTHPAKGWAVHRPGNGTPFRRDRPRPWRTGFGWIRTRPEAGRAR